MTDAAFQENRLMVAALNLAARGVPAFPCNPHTKAPLVPGDTDPITGNKIPKTGGFYKATTDETQIRQWWARWPNAMIGVPAGPRSGFWAIDPDAPKAPGQVDGRHSWAELQMKHGQIPATHTHLTPGGGKHVLFKWDDSRPVTNSEGEIEGLGINVRGEGGYLIFPPSVMSSGRAYGMEEALDWFNFASAPDWLYDLVLEKPKPQPQLSISQQAAAMVRQPAGKIAPKQDNRRYAEAALRGEADELASTTTGNRNRQLNNAALKLGTLVAAGELSQGEVIGALYDAAVANGSVADDGHNAAMATINSGLRKGMSEPRQIPERDPPRFDVGGGNVRMFSNGPTAGMPAVVEHGDPVDLWAKFNPPSLPRGVLPDVIERFAVDQGRSLGADIAGVALATLAVCATAIPDKIQLQVKRHNPMWLESARLWVALVGPPSTMKSPILSAAIRPLRRIDTEMARRNASERAKYDSLPADERKATTPPAQTRILLQDTTIEAVQEIIKDSPDGMLCYQDELSGWFGSMDKYSGARGAAKDRAFWLESFNGSPYSVNRIGRGSFVIDNLSISMLGGIQPEPFRKVADDSTDDGLLQRLLPIMLKNAVIGTDEPQSSEVSEYSELINRLHNIDNAFLGGGIKSATLQFDNGAQEIRRELEKKHLDLQACESFNRKLAAHIGKYNGIFARLCVIWHCVDNARGILPATITEDTARRVAAFLHSFILPHAISFYAGVLGLSDEHDRLTTVAGYILAHKLEKVTNRDIQRGDRTMRRLERRDTDRIFEQLDAFGWVTKTPGPRATDAPHWIVNPIVHQRFAERAGREAEQRERVRGMISGIAAQGMSA